MPTKIKIYILAFISIVLQSGTWFILHRALFEVPSIINWVSVAIVAAAAISVTTFFMLVNTSSLLANSLIGLSAIIYLLLFPHNPIVWFGGLVFCLFAFWYEHRVWREAKSRVDFAVTHVMGNTVYILLYGMLLLLGFNIYSSVSADFQKNPDKYYNRLGQQTAKSVPYVAKIFPGVTNLDQSVSQYFQGQARQDPNYQYASSQEKNIIFEEAKKTFEQEFQITADNSESLSQVMADVVVGKIKQAAAPYQTYIPIVFAILITGLLYTFAFVIRWLVLAISWILFRVLLAAGFFKLEKVQVTVEKLGL